MPLTKQIVPIPFRGGVDTRTDPKQVVPAKLLTAENVVFTSPGRLKKRSGYAALTRAIGYSAGGTGALADGQALATFGDELLLADSTSLYSYDAAAPAWISKGSCVSAHVTRAPVVRDTNQQTAQDGVTHAGGLQFYAWEDSSGGVRYAVLDSATGQAIVPSTLVSANGVQPRTLVIGGMFLLVYYDTTATKLYVAALPVLTPTASLSPAALTAAVVDANSVNTTTPSWDAAIVETAAGEQAYLAFHNALGTISVWRFMPSNLAVPASKLASPIAEAGHVVTVFAGWDGVAGAPIVALYNGADVKATALDMLLTAKTTRTIETVANVVSVAGVTTFLGTAPTFRIFYTRTDSTTWGHTTRKNTLSATYVSGTAAALMVGAALAAKPFAYGPVAAGQLAHVPLAYLGALQPTVFVVDHTANVVAKLLPGLAGGVPTTAGAGAAMLPGACGVDDGTFRLALLERGSLEVSDGVTFTQTGVSALTLDFADAQNGYARAELGRNLHLGGGFLAMYDGVSVVEHGFHLFPEGLTATAGGGGTGALAAGQYQYVACYEWLDAQGQIHRSAPSVPVTMTAVATGSGSVTVPCLQFTAKAGGRSAVQIVLYRTAADGSIFYRLSSPTAPTANAIGTDKITYADTTVTDTALQGNAQLYTTGDVLENIAPPSIGPMAVHRSRVFGLDSTNPLQVWFSKQVAAGAPAEFSDVLFLNVDPRGGPVTALASLDDKLVVFKASRAFFVTGQGPDATGAQSDFGDAVEIPGGVGCVDPRSVVATPAGLMFRSSRGFHLLGRDLSVSYVGADVEAYNGNRVTSAQAIPTTTQVRFTLDSGVALVFDTLVGQWAVFTNHAAVDSAVWLDSFVYLRSDGTALQESATAFSDAGSHIRLRVVTSWLSFASLQGFQRVYRAMILGEYVSAHSLLVQAAYDFNPAFVQADTITPSAPGAYGDDSPYGSGTPYGGEFPLYEWRVDFARQKCTAVQLSLEDVQSGSPSEGFSLSAITLLAGIKGGQNRVPATRSFG
jgi:hypothetical protein